MNIKITAESIKLVIFLALIPFFAFSVSIASRAIYAVDEFAPPVNAENNLRILRMLNPDLPAGTIATLRVEIADNSEEQARGLSGRESLSRNRGMLFVFPEPDNHSFWMKDMNFGLDFVWINGDTVAEITADVKPPGSLPLQILTPKEKVDKVLEINAGAAKRLNIKVGDKMDLL